MYLFYQLTLHMRSVCFAVRFGAIISHIVDQFRFISDEWFCSPQCSRKGGDSNQVDRVLEYSRALTWDGLNHLVRRDAIRQGDGAAMMQHWALDMIQFANNNHPKYVVLAHQLLAGMYRCVQRNRQGKWVNSSRNVSKCRRLL